MKTLVIGASENPERYSNRAVKSLLKHGHEVLALGARTGQIENVKIDTGKQPYENIHTVTMYLGAARQAEYYEYILGLHPSRVIFNPGSENSEFEQKLKKANIETLQECTLVLLRTGAY